jgi:hypothetical protein
MCTAFAHTITDVTRDGIIRARVRKAIPIDSDSLTRSGLAGDGDVGADYDSIRDLDQTPNSEDNDL